MHERNSTATLQDRRSLYLKSAFVLALTVLTVLVCWLVPAPKPGGESGVVMELPSRVGSLYGFDEKVTPEELYILPGDTTFARKTYGSLWADKSDRVLCSIILSGAERRSIHRPERCLPSQGWRIESSRVETIPLSSGKDLKVTALFLNRGATLRDGTPLTLHSYYLYWFVGKDMTTPSQTDRILKTYWGLLTHRVNQRWAYVIVTKNISKDWRPDGKDPATTLTELKQFIHDSVPAFMKSEMPEEQTAAK